MTEIPQQFPGYTVREYPAARGDERPSVPRGDAETLPLIDIDAWTKLKPPPREWIVPPLIPARNVTDLAGDGGVGKSLLALQLMVAMATGGTWLGRPIAPAPTLYLSCEDEPSEIWRRLVGICEHAERPLAALVGHMHIVDLTVAEATELAELRNGEIHITSLMQRMVATVIETGAKLVVLDTRADVFAGNEIDRAQVRFFVRHLRRVCLQHDFAILMLSHPSLTGMATKTGQSGSTAWGNSVRSRLYLERTAASGDAPPDPDLRVLGLKKANFGPLESEFTLRWRPPGVFVLEHEMASQTDRHAQALDDEAVFLELLKEIDRQGRHVNDAGGPYYAPSTFGEMRLEIGKRRFRAAMERLFRAGKIVKKAVGPPSRPTYKIVINET